MKIIGDDEKYLIEQANQALASLIAFNPSLSSWDTRSHVDAKIKELSTFIAERVRRLQR